MLHTEINTLIAKAMKNKELHKLAVLKLLKARFVEIEHSNTPNIDEAREAKILKNIKKEWEEEAEGYRANLTEGHKKSLDKITSDLEVLKEFLPKEASEDEVKACVLDIIGGLGHELTIRDMGAIQKAVKAKFNTADGAFISKLVKEKIAN